MDTYEKLYFTIMSDANHIHKGSFNYKSNHVEKDGDVSCEYNKLNFNEDNTISILLCTEIASNVRDKGVTVSYSSTTERKILKTFTFDELINSEYWDCICKKYKFNKTMWDRYTNNYVTDDIGYTHCRCESPSGDYIDISFNKMDGYIDISTDTGAFDGDVKDLRLVEDSYYCELLQCEKIVDLIRKNHKVDLLSNGYVIDGTYYEEIDDYE